MSKRMNKNRTDALKAIRKAMDALADAAAADRRHAEALHARPDRPITDRELRALEIAAQDAAHAAAAATAAYLEERAKLPALREEAEREERAADRELEALREETARARAAFENQPDWSRQFWDTSAELK